MAVEDKPGTEVKRDYIYQQPDLVVSGEINGSTNWKEWRHVYVAPRKPTYSRRGIQKVYERFLRQGFEISYPVTQSDWALSFGSISYDLGRGFEGRLLLTVFPDEEMARETYEFDQAFHDDREGKGSELLARYRSEGRRIPESFIPLTELRSKWWHHQLDRVKEALHFPL